MDFENFFNSITTSIFWNAWEKELPRLEEAQKIWVEKILFWCPSKKTDGKKILSVGAPSSPSISNFCLLHFDKQLNEYCQINNIIYSRYADDLTFSSNKPRVLFLVPSQVQKLLQTIFNGNILINKRKTFFSSMAHNRYVTGITITNEGRLSLGRGKKKYIKHLVHHYNCKLLNKRDTHHLKGLLSFVKHIEPNFITSLENKYTPKTIQKIFSEKLT